ncbi:MAG: energy transducer TonB [Cytophagales bacterium]|jgi:protein TonB|nr:energy transducer TonB [Cytophagales bacterium]MCE2893272.1 TonB family protein [Flammeovirgaceae bacterium]MCA6365962.1 energy transducer TonB [Cytophagales bacterium]MCA6373251.1 energy transducer TonB [Cytophagales bacterium]MCA6374875.1 energy transducer TonB [Cytophagales bacterium]
MESKKTQKADLSNKRGLFFSIGLFSALSVALMAFEWKQTDEKVDLLSAKSTNTFEEMIEVPTTQQLPPLAPVIQQPKIVEVPDEEEIQENLNIDLDNESPRIEVASVAVAEAEEEVDEIFTIVEESAMPNGGMPAFYKYLVDNMRYPAQARRLGVEGKVTLSFVVDKNGKISEVNVLRGIGSGCDEEAVRVMQNAPSWKPGKQRGKAVKQRCIMPISFKM